MQLTIKFPNIPHAGLSMREAWDLDAGFMFRLLDELESLQPRKPG